MDNWRRGRLESQIKRAVSEILFLEAQDPRIREVTLQRIAITGDASVARIYYSSALGEGGRKSLQEALEHARGFVRKGLAERLKLRSVPDLEFYYESL